MVYTDPNPEQQHFTKVFPYRASLPHPEDRICNGKIVTS